MSRLLATYDPLAITFTQGEGMWLIDEQQNRYLDAISGIGVNVLGHNHPQWVLQAKHQAQRLVHVSNLYQIPEKEVLAERLCQLTKMDKVFFANSGSEANETAIKVARLYGHRNNIDNPTIIVFENAFHGRTVATLSASGHRQIQAGFEPLASGFIRVPFGDLNALKKIANERRDVAAVLIEPIQGAGGIHVASVSFLQALRTLCSEQKWLFMVDEIQTGLGRTGKFLGIDHAGIKADVLTLAKGLANGIAIGACLTSKEANHLFSPEKHGSTLGGNPFACAMALKTVEILQSERLIENAYTQGLALSNRLQTQFAKHKAIKELRGKGLMLGMECHAPCKPIVTLALSEGLLVNVPQPHVVRFLPPFIIQANDIDVLSEKFEKVLHAFLHAQ